MLWLVVGAAILFALMGGLRAFERASVTSIKALFTWIAALGGLSLALLLVLTGRGGIAVGALTLFGPLVYQQWQAARGRKAGNGNDNGGTGPRARPSTGPMSRQEAFDVLGLQPGATERRSAMRTGG